MTAAAFVVQFPEFEDVDATLLNAMLAAALLEIDVDVWGAKADQGQAYLAAHKLALSPFGNNAKMVVNGIGAGLHGNTTYGTHYDSLVLQVGGSYRLTS